MATITVSRELGSLGTEIANALASGLGYAKIDKESLEPSLKKLGMAEQRFSQYDEKKPGFWEFFSTEKERYIIFMKTAMYRFALERQSVIVGRGAHIMFRDVPGVLRLRVIAPREVRAARLCERLRVDEQRALAMIRQSDQDRAGYHKFFFSSTWDSPADYDLVVNTGKVTPAEVCEMVSALLRSPKFAGAADIARARLGDLCIVQDVIVTILYRERIPVMSLGVACHDGEISLSGEVQVESHIEHCAAVARTVEGVKDVANNLTVANYGAYPYYVMM